MPVQSALLSRPKLALRVLPLHSMSCVPCPTACGRSSSRNRSIGDARQAEYRDAPASFRHEQVRISGADIERLAGRHQIRRLELGQIGVEPAIQARIEGLLEGPFTLAPRTPPHPVAVRRRIHPDNQSGSLGSGLGSRLHWLAIAPASARAEQERAAEPEPILQEPAACNRTHGDQSTGSPASTGVFA